jgi:hypothetical protein
VVASTLVGETAVTIGEVVVPELGRPEALT